MACTRTYCLALLLSLSIFSCVAATADATSETFSLPAGQTTTRTVDLNADDDVTGRISVVDGNLIFMVYGPAGNMVVPVTTVVASDLKFKAVDAGTYSFVFDNSQSTEDKTVSINYDVKHYWFGMPQEFVLMLIIVFLGVLGLIVYAKAMRK